MTLNWQPFETMPLNRDVFVFSEDGGVDVACKSEWSGGYHYSASHVGGYDMDWDFDGWGSTLIIAWADIPDDKPSWYVPKPPPEPLTDEEIEEMRLERYKNPIFRAADTLYGGAVIRVVDDADPAGDFRIGDTLTIRTPSK